MMLHELCCHNGCATKGLPERGLKAHTQQPLRHLPCRHIPLRVAVQDPHAAATSVSTAAGRRGGRAGASERANVMETHEVLEIAEEDISDYCTSLYGDDENETSRCWTAYQYFEEQKAASEQGCELEIRDGVVQGVDCNRLESFESFIRELVKQGKVKNLVKTLATLAGAETRQKARNDAAEAEADAEAEAKGPRTVKALVAELDSEVPGNATPAKKILRSVLLEVFDEHDYNKDGKMDVAEFRAAMASLGDELSANTVRTIYQSLGATFFLTFEQFATVVEAEEIRAHSRFAKSLRTLARGSSKWWTEAPDH